MLSDLFNESLPSARFQSYLAEVASGAQIALPEPEIKSYPDAVYFNYYTLGLSFLFTPSKEHTQAPLDYGALSLDSIDIYNTTNDAKQSKSRTYSRYPLLPMKLSDSSSASSPSQFELKAESTGQDLVGALGEPTRKGGGGGPSTGSIPIWCEWSALGIMVEFGGDEARGPQAWERGKNAIWRVVTVFPPKNSSV